MFEKFKYLYVGLIMLAVIMGSVACDDESVEFDEWTSTYVYLDRNIGGSGLEFFLKHTPSGIEGDVVIPFVLKLSKASSSDISVILKSEFVDTELEQTITTVIPAGSTMVKDTIRITGWDFALEIEPSVVYSGSFAISEVTPALEGLKVSPKLNKEELTVTKGIYSQLTTGVAPSGKRIDDRSAWTVSALSGSDWYSTTKVTDGDNGSYEYAYNKLAFEIDLGSEKAISGVETYSNFGDDYAHSTYSISISNDGVEWTPLCADGEPMVVAATQYVSLLKSLNARYIRWYMWGSNCLSSEMYVWENVE